MEKIGESQGEEKARNGWIRGVIGEWYRWISNLTGNTIQASEIRK